MQQGSSPNIKTLDSNNYFCALNDKLTEEVVEYLEDYNIEELADIVEVIYALVQHQGLSLDEFDQIRAKKHDERGGFENRLFLVDVKHNLKEKSRGEHHAKT